MQFRSEGVSPRQIRPIVSLCFLFLSCLLISCEVDPPGRDLPDRQEFYLHLEKGDSIYAIQSGYGRLAESLEQFNIADSLARLIADPVLIAEAVFARGRIYDAWNKIPEKTIEHFAEASRLFSDIEGQELRAGYAKYLLAHAYDKIEDSTNCVRVLSELYEELIHLPDTTRRTYRFIPEMALAATTVGNYELAEDILQNLTKPAWIKNDPETYNYADRTFITRSRIDIYQHHQPQTPYLDSLTAVFWRSPSIFDQLYYSFLARTMYREVNQLDSAYKYLNLEVELLNDIHNNSNALVRLHDELKKAEEFNKRQSVQIEKDSRRIKNQERAIAMLLMSGLICFLLLEKKNTKKYRLINRELQSLNSDLDKKNEENRKLNLEIHHRVKNNLAVIGSLLEMQARKARDQRTRKELQTARNRIRSIADTHHYMMRGQSIGNAGEYVKELLNGFIRSFGHQSDTVDLELEVEEFPLSSRESFSLAIILNELILNTFKHASTQGESIGISVVLYRSKDEELMLRYEDSGLPGRYTEQPVRPGMGLSIINMLADNRSQDDHPFKYNLSIFS